MLFKIADKIIYGETGVCIVEDICEKEFIKNQKKLYYILRPVQNKGNVIYAPVENCKIAMRNIITKQEAENIINNIPKNLENMDQNEPASIEEYKNEICKHDPKKLVELTAKIYNKKKAVALQKKRLNAIDEKYMKIAENLLFGELAEVLGISINDVPKYISQQIEK